MKNSLMCLFMVLLFGIFFGMNWNSVNAEEIELPPEEVEVQYESKVIISNLQYGEILSDIEEGHAGDKVTMKVSPYVFYQIESVTVNGTSLVANEEGNYEFLLVEGDNVVNATFVLDNAQLKTIAGLMADVKDGKWSEIFNLKNLLTILSWVVMAFFSSGFFVTLLKNKKIEVQTTEKLTKTFKTIIEKCNSEAITGVMTTTVAPVIDKINEQFVEIEKVSKVLTRCTVLAQENTPEARMAIIKELTELKTAEQELADSVKEIIDAEIKKDKEEKEALSNAIEELKKANENVKLNKKEESDDGYGQI